MTDVNLLYVSMHLQICSPVKLFLKKINTEFRHHGISAVDTAEKCVRGTVDTPEPSVLFLIDDFGLSAEL